MRPARFQEWAQKTLSNAPGILAVEPWQDGTSRPFGLKVTLANGGQVWPGITAVSVPGEDYSQPEQSIEDAPPAEVPLPQLPSGKVPIAEAEQYLAAVLNNSGCPEIAQVYAYSDREEQGQNPGVGVVFHSGARINMGFVHAMSSGRSPGRAWDLPTAV